MAIRHVPLQVAFQALLVYKLVLMQITIDPEHIATIRDLAFQGLVHQLQAVMLLPVLL